MSGEVATDFGGLSVILALSDAEYRAFRFLHETGGAGAGAVATAVGLPRGRIYDLLRELVARGLVRELPGTRITYVPVPMVEVLQSLRAQKSSELRLLDEAAERLGTVPGPAQEVAARTRAAAVSLLRGRRAVEAEIRRLIDRSRERCWLAGSRHLAHRLASQTETLRALADATGRGVDMGLVLPHVEEERVARARLEEALGARHVIVVDPDEAPPPTLVVSDAVALQVAVQPMDASTRRGADVAIRAESAVIADGLALWLNLLTRRAPAGDVLRPHATPEARAGPRSPFEANEAPNPRS